MCESVFSTTVSSCSHRCQYPLTSITSHSSGNETCRPGFLIDLQSGQSAKDSDSTAGWEEIHPSAIPLPGEWIRNEPLPCAGTTWRVSEGRKTFMQCTFISHNYKIRGLSGQDDKIIIIFNDKLNCPTLKKFAKLLLSWPKVWQISLKVVYGLSFA